MYNQILLKFGHDVLKIPIIQTITYRQADSNLK